MNVIEYIQSLLESSFQLKTKSLNNNNDNNRLKCAHWKEKKRQKLIIRLNPPLYPYLCLCLVALFLSIRLSRHSPLSRLLYITFNSYENLPENSANNGKETAIEE